MQLLTERLILREFKEDDWPDILAYQVDPRQERYKGHWGDRLLYAILEDEWRAPPENRA